MSRRGQVRVRFVVLVAIPLVAIAGGLFWWLSGGRYVSTDNAYVKAHIVQIAPEVSGQVRRVPVQDHAIVVARRCSPSNRDRSGWRSTVPRPNWMPRTPRSKPCAAPGARR